MSLDCRTSHPVVPFLAPSLRTLTDGTLSRAFLDNCELRVSIAPCADSTDRTIDCTKRGQNNNSARPDTQTSTRNCCYAKGDKAPAAFTESYGVGTGSGGYEYDQPRVEGYPRHQDTTNLRSQDTAAAACHKYNNLRPVCAVKHALAFNYTCPPPHRDDERRDPGRTPMTAPELTPSPETTSCDCSISQKGSEFHCPPT